MQVCRNNNNDKIVTSVNLALPYNLVEDSLIERICYLDIIFLSGNRLAVQNGSTLFKNVTPHTPYTIIYGSSLLWELFSPLGFHDSFTGADLTNANRPCVIILSSIPNLLLCSHLTADRHRNPVAGSRGVPIEWVYQATIIMIRDFLPN